MSATDRRIGFWPAVALVAGNMIGSGIFLLPASLSPYGRYSLYGWLLSSAGAVLLALIFSRLSRRLPITGGPYLYTQRAFGAFPGFLVAWGYWVALWTGNAAIVIAFVSNLTPFLPLLKSSPVVAALASAATIWVLTGINLLGVREAAGFQLFTTVLRLLPILVIGTAGYLYFHPEHLAIPASGPNAFEASLATAALTLWSFLGIESATIPAADIRDPDRNIGKATVLGTVFSALVYIAACTAVTGILPPAALSASAAPFADAAGLVWGKAGYFIVAAAAATACLGALTGWILLQGQIPWAAARDGLFPAFFRRKNRRGAPAVALVLSSVLITFMIGLNYSDSLQKQFQDMILLATLATLIPYLFCSVAELAMRLKRDPVFPEPPDIRLALLSLLALLFSVAAVAGTGGKAIVYGLILLAAGVPVYYFLMSGRSR